MEVMEVKNLLDVYQRNSREYEITVKDEEGNPKDISDWTVYFVVKKDYDDSDGDAVINKKVEPLEHEDPTNGITNWKITQNDTDVESGMYVYDITYTEPNDPANRVTLQTGDFKIKQVVKD